MHLILSWLLWLLARGSLPWAKAVLELNEVTASSAGTKKSRVAQIQQLTHRIQQFKTNAIDNPSLPRSLCSALVYLRQLKFAEKVDYERLWELIQTQVGEKDRSG